MPTSFWPALLALGVLVGLWFIQRRSATNRARALILDTKNPEASRDQLHAIYAAEEAKEKADRARLWNDAQTNPRAAKELRRRLQTDLEEEDEIRKLVGDSPTKPSAEEWEQLRRDRVELLEQIARVDALISRLRV